MRSAGLAAALVLALVYALVLALIVAAACLLAPGHDAHLLGEVAITARLAGVLRGSARAGLAVVLVEHDMGLAMAVSDAINPADAFAALAPPLWRLKRDRLSFTRPRPLPNRP